MDASSHPILTGEVLRTFEEMRAEIRRGARRLVLHFYAGVIAQTVILTVLVALYLHYARAA